MSNFAECVKQETPRLVVMFRQDEAGTYHFQWGVEGSIPILYLMGAISRAQYRLCAGAYIDNCPQQALVFAWDETNKSIRIFSHPQVPADAMVGMLETVKTALVMSSAGQRALSNRTQILGADGVEMRR
jgi:hypothetical protein